MHSYSFVRYIPVSALCGYPRNINIRNLDTREIGGFNSREIAVFICVSVFLSITCFRYKPTRDSVKQVLKAFFVKDIVVVCILAILHIFAIVIILHSIGFWKLSLLKDTIIWLIFSAFVTIFSVNEADKDKNYFRGIIINNIKFSEIIEFITEQYTFNIFIEILLTIMSFFIGGLLAFSKGEKFKDVNKLLNVIAIFIGGVMLYHSLSEIIQNVTTIDKVEKSGEFSLPIIDMLQRYWSVS